MLSTYVKAIEKKAVEGRIHTTFKLHITPTGRLSSSDPNIQNIPRLARWKRMYCARAGMKLLEADYNTAELRALAALSADEVLTAIFLDDKRNLHDEVSVSMYGPDFTQDQRIRAKAINFGIPYGREAYSIAVEFDIDPDEAQRLIDAWLARFPQAATFLKDVRGAPLRNESLVSVFGRKRRPGIVSAERLHGLQNEFSNFHFQSIISDFNLHAAKAMLPSLRKCGSMIVNLVHDSNLVEVPDNLAIIRDVRDIMQHYMEGVPKLWLNTPITFKSDFKIGKHWGYLNKLKG
jgi:DNA polymerase-1